MRTRSGALADVASLVPQQTFLFDDTVRGNVSLGAELCDDDMWSALRLSEAPERFIRRVLPDGLDTLVGEARDDAPGG